jgi:serine/threonine protein phosphatase PrpC
VRPSNDDHFFSAELNVVGGNETGVHVEAHALDVRAGERPLLCSNGLPEMVTDDVITAVLEKELDQRLSVPTSGVGERRGGRDNVTVLIVRFDSVDPEPAGRNPAGTDDGRALLALEARLACSPLRPNGRPVSGRSRSGARA